ncbi:unnamed protein product [Arctogadus glacialis]
MVRVCDFPGCGKLLKSYTPEIIQRLPSRYNYRFLVDTWLIVLNMDIETPIEMLMHLDWTNSSFLTELLTQRTQRKCH